MRGGNGFARSRGVLGSRLGAAGFGPLLVAVERAQKALTVGAGKRCADFLEPQPGLMRIAQRRCVVGRDIDRMRLALGAELQVQVRPVPALRIPGTRAARVAALASDLRERALDHPQRRFGEFGK